MNSSHFTRTFFAYEFSPMKTENPASGPVDALKRTGWPLGWLALLVTAPLYLLDQATKWGILLHLEIGDGIPVLPGFFDIVHWRNTGAAFSFMSDSNGFFIGISALAALILLGLAWCGKFRDSRRSGFAWALLLSGILGNLTDRLLHGSVVDFLLFDLHIPYANPWPAFNIADACICIAATLFVWQAWTEPELEKEKAESKNSAS